MSSRSAKKANWEMAWSAERNRWYYQDRTTGKSQWEKPADFNGKVPEKPADAGTPARVLADKDVTQNLDPRWQAVFDPQSKKYYYVNRMNGERTWFRPTVASSQETAKAGNKESKPKTDKIDMLNTFRWDAEAYAARLEDAEKHHSDSSNKFTMKVLAQMKVSNQDLSEVLPHPGVPLKHPPATIEFTAKACQDAVLLGLVEDLGTRAKPKISFSTKRLSSALAYLAARDKRVRVCGVNFANGTKPGGGYMEGEIGDEEDLCRRIPMLYPSLLQAFDRGMYPFGPATASASASKSVNKYSNVLFTPNLLIARGPQEVGFPILSEEQRQLVSIVSAAAPNTEKGHVFKAQDVMNTLRSVMIAPPLQEPFTTTLVFGLWGCSSQEPGFLKPQEVAEMIYKIIVDQGLGRLYDEIHFAIPRNDNNSSDYGTMFRRALEQKHSIRIEDTVF